MRQIPNDLLQRMAKNAFARDEMAIPSYLHRNPVMRWMAWRRVHVIASNLREVCVGSVWDDKPVILDFRCGTGVLFEEASEHAERVYGVDLVLEPARLLITEWNLDNVVLLRPEQAEHDVPENSIDIILAVEVLEHIDPVESALEFFRSRLKSNGRLLVSLPTEGLVYRIGRRLAGFNGHYHHSNARPIHRKILSSGFRMERIQRILAPGPLAIYWIIRYRAT